MPAAVEARLCELRRHHPHWGQRRLAHELARVGIDPPPRLTSICRALVRNGLIQPRPRRRAKASYRRWERDRPMELWQLDIMGGIWLVDGHELKAVTRSSVARVTREISEVVTIAAMKKDAILTPSGRSKTLATVV
jgi:hypothetical protein